MASAQLTISFDTPTQTLTSGGTKVFNAVLGNTGAVPLTLTGFDFTNHPDLLINDTAIYNLAFAPLTINAGQTLLTQELFQVTLATNHSETIPFLYDQNSITVKYTQNNVASFTPKGFGIQSQTPTPPVVLVTLFSGIGTVRMAMRRRKKA